MLDDSYGYAMFPSVGKGGLIVGGGYGKGVVWEHGKRVGYADVTLASIGALVGGQTYAELVVFKDKDSFQSLMDNKLTFSANTSAVILKTGAARKSAPVNGTVVFIKPNVGVMADASIGGQKFTYAPGDVAPDQSSNEDHNGSTETETKTTTENNNQ